MMKETNEKEIVLEDLFFKNDNKVLDIIRSLDNYDEVIFYEQYLSCILDARILKEYMARLDTYIDAQYIQITSKYDKVVMYRFVTDYIKKEIKYQKTHPFESFKDRYTGIELSLNAIKEIRDLFPF